MGLLKAAWTPMQIWHAYLRLGSPDDAERERAMETLRASGQASLTCLRYAVNPHHAPRVQFAAAVVLHRLGQPQGMTALLEALQWRLPETPELAGELEAALIAIGAPDAVTALLGLWKQLPDWGDTQAPIASICRVWAALRDPRALDGLTARSTRIPELFEKTVPAFGEMGVLHLERMTRESDPARRILAIRTLRHIPSGRSFAVLEPLLRDPVPEVRAFAPAALEGVGGAHAAAHALTEAMRAGFSTREAVETLARLDPMAFDTLLELAARWNPMALTPKGDTGTAVLAALPVLARAPSPYTDARLVPTLCALLQRRPGPALLAAIARVLGSRSLIGNPYGMQSNGASLLTLAREALWPLLAHADGEVRTEAAMALRHLGEPLGSQMNELLMECRPQESLLMRLQSFLRAGPDAGQIATQTMQQVSQWFTRVSKETVERLSSGGIGGATSVIQGDTRLSELLRQLLGNALDALDRVTAPEEVAETLSLCVATVRALGRVGAPAALDAREELMRAFCFVKRNVVYQTGNTTSLRNSELRDVADVVRMAAAESLLLLYPQGRFALFLEALYRAPREARVTAIVALGRLGDVRALSHLQPLAADTKHPFQAAAHQAIAAIRGANPEMMTLLRGSSPTDTRADTLLRPASGSTAESRPDLLLRPTTPPPAPPETSSPGAASEKIERLCLPEQPETA